MPIFQKRILRESRVNNLVSRNRGLQFQSIYWQYFVPVTFTSSWFHIEAILETLNKSVSKDSSC